MPDESKMIENQLTVASDDNRIAGSENGKGAGIIEASGVRGVVAGLES